MLQANNLKIGILGLGLIGGSIFKSLSRKGFKIAACSSNNDTIQTIQNNGHAASTDINILKNCEIIFVCVPISQTKNFIKKTFLTNPNAIIADVASLKEEILNFAENLEGCKFVGTHPMAGTEFQGYSASSAELFNQANWVITPSKYVNKKDVDIIKNLISTMGGTTIEMNANEHDKSAALISHLPMLLAESLIYATENNISALKLASSGFRDTTRLAMTNKIMASDMLTLNKENIKNSLKLVIEKADTLLNSKSFDKEINKIIETRANLYTKDGKNNFKNKN